MCQMLWDCATRDGTVVHMALQDIQWVVECGDYLLSRSNE